MKQEQNIQQQPKKSRAKKLILIGVGITALGIASYYGWQYFQGRRNKNEEEDFSADYIPDTTPKFIPSTSSPSLRNDNFPLKKGSKGEKVRQVQQALINKHGSSILPRFGADGDFGTEMVAALQKAGLPSTIDESTYNVLIKSSSLNAMSLAKQLYDAALKKDFSKVIEGLKQMKSVSDYTAVGNVFKNYFLRGVRQTLVNGILGTFADAGQKQQIQLQFSRMGLKYDGSKWSLAGIAKQIITYKPTWVYKYPNEKILVEPNVILGRELAIRGGFTLFESIEKHKLIVKSNEVKYYEKD